MKRAPSVSIKSIASRTFFVMVAAVALALGDGCNQGKEGDRCNPDLAPGESDCNSGLTCQKSPTCAESYCCPTPLMSSLNPFCNGSACPPLDAGN